MINITTKIKLSITMKTNLKASQSVFINAKPEKIWDVLTNPLLIKEYLYGTETVTSWEKGSDIFFQGEFNGKYYRDHGKIIEIIKNKKISYTYWSGFSGLEDKPENYSLVTYILNEISPQKAEFTWEQKGFSTEENHKHFLMGLPELLAKIKTISER